MKAVLISIQPYYVFLIIAKAMGWEIKQHKEIEVRKNYPKAEDWNKVIKIYCSKDKKSFDRIPEKYRPEMKKFLGKVIGHFVCDNVIQWNYFEKLIILGGTTSTYMPFTDDLKSTCLSYDEFAKYGKGKTLYGWHISNLVIYEKPKELSEFFHYCGDDPKCDGCPAHYFSNTECGKEDYCCSIIDGCKPLTRPPQSWQFVEEKE